MLVGRYTVQGQTLRVQARVLDTGAPAMGVAIDMYGVRRTVLTAFPLAIAGAVLCALAQSFHGLLLGQAMIGVGCAPSAL